MILSSIPVYFIFIAWKNKPKFFQKGVGEYKLNKFIGEKNSITNKIPNILFCISRSSKIFIYTQFFLY